MTQLRYTHTHSLISVIVLVWLQTFAHLSSKQINFLYVNSSTEWKQQLLKRTGELSLKIKIKTLKIP